MDIPERLRARFRWTQAAGPLADVSPWWRDPELLAALGPALAALHADGEPTVVAGIESRGMLLGPLVAVHLGLGFVEVHKGLTHATAGEPVLARATPPDHRGRTLLLGVRNGLIRPGDRVLLVDDWVETGAQAAAVRRIVEDAHADWVGVATVVDAATEAQRTRLGVRCLLREEELGWY